MINIMDVLYTEKSRINFIKGLVFLSKAQEISEGLTGIDPEEMLFLENAMNGLQIPQHEREKIIEIISAEKFDIEIEFDNPTQALFFIREGVQICYVDGSYDLPEKEMIYKMGEMLGVNKNKIEEIENWVLEGIKWTEKGNKLIGMGE